MITPPFTYIYSLTFEDKPNLVCSGEQLPLGLIASAWGGTRLGEMKNLGNIFEKSDDVICRVEAWSTPEGLESCGAEGQINEDNPQVASLTDVKRFRKEKHKDISRTPTHICGTP